MVDQRNNKHCQSWYFLSLQLQLPSWNPDYVLQGGRSLLPQRSGGREGGSARILHLQLPPVPGHWTVGLTRSSCASSQFPGHICTHTYCICSLFTHLPFQSHPVQVSCWFSTDSCFFDIGQKNCFFFCFKEVKAICTIHLDRNNIFALFFMLYLTYVPLLMVKLSDQEPLVFLPMQLFSLCTATETYCHECCPHKTSTNLKTHNALDHLYPLLF